MCILEIEQNQEQARSELFCGSIKSFNSRRGFGFVSCEETALRFGRDVYLSKDEAMLLAADPAIGVSASESSTAAGNDQSKVPPVKEGDVLLFEVKLSTEGFPQAVQAQKIRRLQGVVQQVPSSGAEGIVIVSGDARDDTATIAKDADDALKQLLGAEVRLCQAECGQLQLMPGDEIAFCCGNMADTDGQPLGAQLVELVNPCFARSVLGCFSMQLPQRRHPEDASSSDVPSIELQGYALSDCIVLSNVPASVGMSDLMYLFGKVGGKETSVTMANGNATITLGGPELVAKFLVQTTHTISENGITQVARVGPCLSQRFGSGCSICGGSVQSKSEQNDVEKKRMVQDNQTMIRGNLQHDIGQTLQPLDLPRCSPCVSLEPVAQQPSNSISSICSAPQSLSMPLLASTSTLPGWRCIHSNIVVAPVAPEMLIAADNCCSACVQWPTVVHASAYVVELLDQSTMMSQRFVRPMPEGILPTLVDLRVEGLQPGAYAACVRSMAPCGCESVPSQWSFLSLGSLMPSGAVGLAPALHMLPPNAPADTASEVPQMCPPPSEPPALPLTAATTNTILPPIPEEIMDRVGSSSDDVITLD